ncbi:MAG: type II toxin-antitoxin system VapC family toxin [Thermodesulfobacteriota bacterium]|nr:type II toxin-antitoxin system VapC family toxin [Thermodesulfobacteriota bacterium]
MFLVDVNVLVYAHRGDTPNHPRYRRWLESIVNADSAYGMSDLVLSGFLRIVTHPRVFREPSPLDAAIAFAHEVMDRPNCVLIQPGERHWGIFERLCHESGAKGNLISDAFFAALAIESGSIWVTMDRDYTRFRGLRWQHPFD